MLPTVAASAAAAHGYHGLADMIEIEQTKNFEADQAESRGFGGPPETSSDKSTVGIEPLHDFGQGHCHLPYCLQH